MTAAAEKTPNHLLPAQHPILQTRTIEGPIEDLDQVGALVDKHRANLVRMMASALPFASTDGTRSGLNRVQLEVHDEKSIMLMATDGHTAIALAVEFFDLHGLGVGCVGLTRDSVVGFIKSKGYSPLAACDPSETFPWLRNVITPTDAPYAGVFAVNASYFARNSTAMSKLGYSKGRPMRIECGETNLSPILMTAHPLVMKDGPSVKLMTVTMPVRME
jgi:hypothetical protein